MKVNGKQTIVQNVEVDIPDEEVMNIVKAQTPDYLADVLTKELLRNFIYSLPADFTGKRAVWETRKRGYEKFLVLHQAVENIITQPLDFTVEGLYYYVS